MKKIMVSLLLSTVLISGCVQTQSKPVVKLQCWQPIVSNAFPFVISAINICDGPEGGTVKSTTIQPILDYIDELNIRTEKIRKENLKLKRMEKLY